MNAVFFCFQLFSPRYWDYFMFVYLIYMLLLFPGFPPHFAMGYTQDYKVNSLKWSGFGVGRRDYSCTARRMFEYSIMESFRLENTSEVTESSPMIGSLGCFDP